MPGKLDFLKSDDDNKNRWRVYAVVIVGVLIGLLILYGLYAITEPVVKEKDVSLSTIDNLYAFYDLKVGLNETTVYFIGSSLTSFEIYSPLIDDELQKHGYNITSYNLFVEADTPRLRVFQIEAIIDSAPSMIIYGVSYRTITTNDINQERTLASLSHVNLTSDLKSFYTNSELINLNYGSFYQKGYVLSNLKQILSGKKSNKNTETQAVISPQTALNYAKDSTSDLVKKKSNETKDIDSIREAMKNPNNDWRPVVPSGDTLNKKAFSYILNKLNKADIPVIVISMPVSPLLSEKITEDSRNNFHNYLNETGVVWIDMETMYDDNHFYDSIHATWEGALEFSDEMADLIIEQVENDVIHYT